MNKKVLLFVVLVSAIAVYFLFFKKSTQEQIEEKVAVKEEPKVATAFETQYLEMLSIYQSLNDALVKTDATQAQSAAQSLASFAEGISIDDIKGDTEGLLHETATSFKNQLVNSAKAIADLTDIEAQRVQFEGLSQHVWDLTRTVRYSASTVYLQHCPMAFNDKGANWVSLSADILNPYFGDKMLKCGVVKDSIQ